MPCPDTFAIKPISELVSRYAERSQFSVDPFARNSRLATFTNDINPNTSADFHMDAEAFLKMLMAENVKCDLAILDPPYSPRQISECYRESEISCGMKETQNAALYSRVKSAIAEILLPSATVLSFGWNSSGMGKKHGFEIREILLVCHGGAHNDTICTVETRA